MKKGIVLLLILVSASMFAVSVGGPISANGEYWAVLTDNEKMTFVTGVLVGLCYANMHYQGYPADGINLATPEDLIIVIKMLDSVYENPENVYIRVVDAIGVAWMALLEYRQGEVPLLEPLSEPLKDAKLDSMEYREEGIKS